MQAPDEYDADRLAAIHSFWRKRHGRIWLAAAALVAIAFLAAWLATDNRDYLYSAIFFPFIPLSGYVYWCFFLLNPRREPEVTQQKMVELERQQQRNARTVAKVNGTILLLASPIFLLLAAGTSYESLGWPGAVLGLIAVGVCFIAGPLAMIRWARRPPPR